MVCLFNGYRQVVYGFVSHCRMATLRAMIGDRELSTMVSTTDLNVTTGKVGIAFHYRKHEKSAVIWRA